MSMTALVEPAGIAGKQRWLHLYWVTLLAPLFSEVLFLTLRFDRCTLAHRQGWLSGIFDWSSGLVRVGTFLGIVVSLVLIGSVRGDPEMRRLAESHVRSPRLVVWLTAHLASATALALITWLIFEGSALSSNPVLSVPAWIATSSATLGFWMLAALPLVGWLRLVETRWRALLAGPLLAIAALFLGRWTSSFWDTFHSSTFWAARGVLGLFSSDVICLPDEFKLGTHRFGVEIADACAGYEGIGLIWMFLGVFLCWFRRDLRFPQAFLLLPLGTMLSWSVNVLRIAALIVVGDRGFPEVAMGGFHSQGGWLAFNAIGLGLVLLARRARLFSRVESRREADSTTTVNPAAAFLAPIVAIALTMMLTAVVAHSGFDRFYAARVLAAIVVFAYFRRQYATLLGSWSWDTVAVGLIVYVIWMALEPIPKSHEAMTLIPDSLARMSKFWAGAWLVGRAIGSVVVIPVAEELAFRGFLTRRLISRDFQDVPEGQFTWASFLVSSLVFGLLHQRWFAGTIAGLAYALIYYRRGKLVDAVVAHAVTNLSITVYVFATCEWYRWS